MISGTSSLRQVAEEAEVSVATVSRVLNNTGRNAYAPATAERVHRVAKRLGYRPNMLMRGVAGRATRTIGVLVPAGGDFYSRVVEGIHDRLAEADYAMVLAWNKENIAPPDSAEELKLVHRLVDRRVDGVILRPTHDSVSDMYFSELWKRHIPLAAVDRAIPSVRCDFAGTDDVAVGRLAAEHLLGLGHRCLGHLAGPAMVSTAKDRRAGFEQAVAAFGHGAQCVTVEAPDFSGVQEDALRLLRADPRPTGIFAANDEMAEMVYAGGAEAGVRIPDGVSVVGCGNLLQCRYLSPALTTFDQHPYRIGQEAARLMLERVEGDGNHEKPREVRVTPEIVVRGSSCVPPAGGYAVSGSSAVESPFVRTITTENRCRNDR
jgi:LacI family transcriptional regulator